MWLHRALCPPARRHARSRFSGPQSPLLERLPRALSPAACRQPYFFAPGAPGLASAGPDGAFFAPSALADPPTYLLQSALRRSEDRAVSSWGCWRSRALATVTARLRWLAHPKSL